MKNYLKVIGMLHEQDDVMTCEFLTNEANVQFVPNSIGVANFTSNGYFKEGKVIAMSKPTYGSPDQDCNIDVISSAPNTISIASLSNGVPTGNIFYHTPFTILIKIP